MADTALTIISDALLDLGVLPDGATPTASQSSGALRKLNNMIDDWSIQNLLTYGSTPYVVPLVANKQTYTVGPGGDVNIPRPDVIAAAFVRSANNGVTQTLDTPVAIFTDEEWQELPLKLQAGAYPNWGIWPSYQNAQIQIYVTPIPTTGLYSLVLWINGLLSGFNLSDQVILAPGYKRALTANLAIELASSYEVQPSPSLAAIAESSKANLKVKNFQLNRLASPGYAQYDNTSNTVFLR